MTDQAWIGGIYLKEDGGYEIVIRALRHYLKVLRNIATSPGVSDSPAIAQLLQQEANRTGPRVLGVGKSLKVGLTDPAALAAVGEDLEYVRRALDAYAAGVRRAADGDPYYAELVEPAFQNDDEIRRTEEAKVRVAEYA